jgi:cobalamin 5'-phosphate synthase/cobalamin synthase
MPALDAFATALAFLTRVPFQPRAAGRDGLARAAPLFALVGAALGAAVGACAAGLADLIPVLAAAAVAAALELALTGALHLDGLADSADGLAGRERDRVLEIMRDPLLGTYGGAALTLDVLAKVAALAALAEADQVLPVVAAFAVGRAAPLPLAAALPYARRDESTGGLLAGRLRPGPAGAGVVLAAAIAVAALVGGTGVAYALQADAAASLRASGQAGEQADGYLGLVGSAPAAVRAQVDSVNIKRRSYYTDLAAKRGAKIEEVAATTACELFRTKVAPGQYYRLPDGVWRRRNGSEPVPRPTHCG